MVPLTGKFVETSKKSAIFDIMLLHGCKASFDYFSILLKEENTFKSQLKESLLISCDKSVLNNCLNDYNVVTFCYFCCYLCNPMSVVSTSVLLIPC